MWFWAIDPDHEAPATSDNYQGYIHVRLQQIVNNFFESQCFSRGSVFHGRFVESSADQEFDVCISQEEAGRSVGAWQRRGM